MKQWYRLLAAGLALALLTGCAGGAAPSGQAAQPMRRQGRGSSLRDGR